MKKERKEEYKKDADKLLKDAKNRSIKDVKILSKKTVRRMPKTTRADSIKYDGWLNVYTGIGTSRDKSKYTTFLGYEYLDDKMLTELWVGDGYGKKVVTAVADDMIREWITIRNDTDLILEDKLKMLDAQSEFNTALYWQRLFGGSLILVGIDDGRELWEEVNMNSIKAVNYLRVFDRTDISLTTMNFNDDPGSPRFGKPEFYTVTPKYSAAFNVHWSRVLEFKGETVPNRIDSGQWWYWGMSVLQSVWTQLKNLSAGQQHIVKLLYEFVIGKYKIKGLAQLMAEDNFEKVMKILDIVELGKSTIQAHIMDADGDDYTRDSVSVSGLPELLDRFMMLFSGVAEIPVTRLFGRSAAGMNATGEGDERNYYMFIHPKQGRILYKPLQYLVNLINISKEIGNKKVEEPVVEFNSLFQETEEQMVKNRKVQAEIDDIYWKMGSISDEEVRVSRFGGGGYSFDTELIEGSFEKEEEDTIVKVPEKEKTKSKEVEEE